MEATKSAISTGSTSRGQCVGVITRPLTLGLVRCLGWQNMELPIELLSTAVEATLRTISVPFSIRSSKECQWSNMLFVAWPVQPASIDAAHLAEVPVGISLPAVSDTDVSDTRREETERERHTRGGETMKYDTMPPPPLRVVIQIIAADAENAGKHHVNVRCTQGDHWGFRTFYSAFRREFSLQLGLPSERLSMYSPMTPKRELEPNRKRPAAGWSCSGAFGDGADCTASCSGAVGLQRAGKRPWQALRGARC